MEYQRNKRQEYSEQVHPEGESISLTTYRNGCRCGGCRGTAREYHRRERERRRARKEEREARGAVHPEGKPHSLSTYNNHNCRCVDCREAALEYQRRRRAKRKGYGVPEKGSLLDEILTPTGIDHGTMRGYRTQGCRCEACRAANREYQRGARARAALTWAILPESQQHGTDNAYTNYGCRCGPCRAAATAQRRRTRERARAQRREET